MSLPKPFGLIAVLAFGAVAAAPGADHAVDEVIAAERAFAATTAEKGFKHGFLAYVAPDGFLFERSVVPARPGLERLPDGPPENPPLQWWPQFAGAALSGDLGFSTGAASIPLRYFTVWKRQADGSWKWIYDGGPRLSALLPGGPADPVVKLAPATAAAGSAEAAVAEIRPIEAAIAQAAAEDAAAARRPYLAPEGLVAGSATATYPGKQEQEAELARQPASQRLRPLGAVASDAGDMAFSWGEVAWVRDDQDRRGHYARIWQKRREGWRLVADLLIAAPPPPPAR